ncbi:MAG: NADH-quinone oxidoreductase subunit D [Thaumarchaeota archaeon]|nr:NADH-quinone oxidoreductase subunit D [Nitrososphaerota archaeon]
MSTMTLSVGPQHPGSGHFRLIITVDGDIIVKAEPDPGYVHRGEEKMAEVRNYIQNIPHIERPSIIDASGILYPYVLAVEDLLGKSAPERAQYIRMIMAELNRITSHLYFLSIFGIFLGHSTMFMWPMGDREVFIDLSQMIGGTRITFSHFVPGGVRSDAPDSFADKAEKTCDYFEGRLKEYERIFVNNPLCHQRTVGVGVLTKEDAIKLGVVGPSLRASGVKSDTRRDEPYDAYDKVDFEVPVYSEGDSYARLRVHFDEMRQSMSIIRQCIKQMPKGPVKQKLPPQLRPPAGEAYARTEAARGAMAYYIVSDGGNYPYRLKMNVASFRNLIAIPYLLKGVHLADMPTVYWGLDYWPVEADK